MRLSCQELLGYAALILVLGLTVNECNKTESLNRCRIEAIRAHVDIGACK